jgi:NADPH-dependent curcumin reductase CurA
MTRMNRQWRLAKRPVGDIQDGDLTFVTEAVPALDDGQVLVRNVYLSLDPTNRIWMSDIDQYMPPVQLGDVMRGGTVGVVEESRDPKVPVGARVVPWLGGWQDYAVVPGAVCNIIPDGFPMAAILSSMGLTGVTGYFGLLDIGKPKAGETLVVSAAAGAVGSIVGQIGKIYGCRVVGIAGSDEKCRWITEDLGFDAAINYKKEDVGAALDRHCPNGIDINFENVGGEIMDAVMARMTNFSRMALCGMISGYNAMEEVPGPKNFSAILMHRITVKGFIVSDYMDRWGEAVAQIGQWVAEGKVKYKVHIEKGLEHAPQTVKRLFTGDHDGKLLVEVSAPPAGG